MAYGVDSEINERVDMYSSDPQKLMQRYGQSQSLLDLLALQKLKSEKEAAMRNMQAQMQPRMDTVKDQREQQVLDMTRNEVAQQAMQGGQQLALNRQRAMQARGLPTQAAPNMGGMMGGGIVGYQAGGEVEDKGMLEKIGRTFLGDESYDIIRQRLEGNKANTQVQPPMTESERVTQLQNLMLKRKAAGATDAEIQRIQEEINSYDLGGVKSGGLKGFEGGGIVGFKEGDLVEEDKPFIPLGALFGLIGQGRDALFSPSRATQEAREIRRGDVEQASERGVNLLNVLPPSQGLTADQLASFDTFDVTGSLLPEVVDARRERVESGEAARMLEQQAARRAEANATRGVEETPAVDPLLTQEMYMVPRTIDDEATAEPTGDGLAGLAAAMQPSRLEELRQKREDVMGGITSPERLQRDKLRAYLSGLGQTGLGGGSEALTKEQQRQDALRVGDLDRLIELEREDVKLQREIDASMAEVVANNEADLAQIMAKAGLEEQMNLAGDRRKFIADVLKQLKDNLSFQQTMGTLNQQLREGDITAGDFTRAQLEAIQQATQALGTQYDIDTALGGSVVFNSGSFE